MTFLGALVGFLLSWLISAVIIYLAVKLFGEKEGFGTAILTALIGAIIFAIAYFLIPIGWVAAFIGGLAWLVALGNLYKMGWLRSFFVALVIWIFAAIVSILLPTVAGPL